MRSTWFGWMIYNLPSSLTFSSTVTVANPRIPSQDEKHRKRNPSISRSVKHFEISGLIPKTMIVFVKVHLYVRYDVILTYAIVWTRHNSSWRINANEVGKDHLHVSAVNHTHQADKCGQLVSCKIVILYISPVSSPLLRDKSLTT